MGGSYDYRLTLLSIMVALMLSLMAFGLAAWIYRNNNGAKQYWRLSGAVAMGTFVWSAHFATLLIFSADKPAHFDLDLMVLSWVVAIAVSCFAFWAVSRWQAASTSIIGVILLGTGLVGMCYLTIKALQTTPDAGFNPSLLSLFVSVLVTISAVVLLALFWIRAPKIKQNRIFAMLGMALLPVFAIGYCIVMATTHSGLVTTDSSLSASTPSLLIVILCTGAAGLVMVTYFVSAFGIKARNHDSLNQSLRQTNLELSQLAMIDTLTQLPNRRMFQQHLDIAAGHVSRESHSRNSLAVAYIDLDGFKPVNDALGHHVGDEVLQVVARRLNMAVRGCDVVARLGGDEFVALIENIKSDEDIILIVDRIVQSLREVFYIANHEIAISASVGIAVYPRDGNTKNLMKCADAAMYRAKSDGKNQFRFFDAEIELASNRLLEMQRELNQALANNEFKLLFQPKIDSKTNALTGVEALLRWRHPVRGMIYPEVFVPAAERFGLINHIGDWVVEEVCRVLYRLRGQGITLNIAINLSPQQFRNPSLVTNVVQMLNRYDLPASSLMFEITGCRTLHNLEQFNSLLADFHAAGLKLAMDDFYTSNFSLAFLRNIKVNVLKLDRTFINDICSNQQSQEVVEAVVRLAHALKLSVVAVGVNMEDQRKLLMELGCDQLQGYLFSRPVPEEMLIGLINQFSPIE